MPVFQSCARRRFVEPLEPRWVLTSLGLDIQLLADDAGAPGAPISQPEQVLHGGLQTGDAFWIRVLAWDSRASGASGVVSLPLNLQWDPAVIDLRRDIDVASPVPLDDPLITSDFPLARAVDAVVAPAGARRIEGLRGAAAPAASAGSAIGVGAPEEFALLPFTAIAEADATPFRIELAGSMAFDDGQILQQVFHLVDGEPSAAMANADNSPFVDEFLAIGAEAVNESASLSGVVFADSNFNGQLDRLSDGRTTELTLANAEVTLISETSGATFRTRSGGDGGYFFHNLEPDRYTLRFQTPDGFFAGAAVAGVVCDTNGCTDPGAIENGEATDDSVRGVLLEGGDAGLDFDLALTLAASQVNKRAFRAATTAESLACELAGVRCVIVPGSETDDVVEVTASDGLGFSVRINGEPPRTIDVGAEPTVLIVDGKGGSDEVRINAGAASETVIASTGSTALTTPGGPVLQGVVTVSAETVDVSGLDEADSVLVLDSPGDDSLEASLNDRQLRSAGGLLAVTLRGRASTVAASRLGGDDTALLEAVDAALRVVGRWRNL